MSEDTYPEVERRRACTDCVSHLLVDERLYNTDKAINEHKSLLKTMREALDRVDGKVLGIYLAGTVAALFVGIIVTILFSAMDTHKAEASEEANDYKQIIEARTDNILATMRSQNKITADQVLAISRDVTDIKQNVAVMVRTFEMSQKEAAHEREANRRALDSILKMQNEKEHRLRELERVSNPPMR